MLNKFLKLALILFILLLFQTSLVFGANISGTVKMEGKKDNSGVLVTIQGRSLSAISSKDGEYSISNVPSGSYTLTAQKPGYLVGLRSDVLVGSGTVSVDFDLTPGDFNFDNQINLLDRIMLTSSWKAKEGDSNWNSTLDIYEDKVIDENDKNLLLANWRKGNANVKLGSLSIESNPAGASILINGADTSKITPYTFSGMVIGEYAITLKLKDYAPVEVKAQVKENQLQILPKVTLDNQPPDFTNWAKEPSNLTEDSKGILRVSVHIADKGGSGMGENIPQFDYHIGTNTSYGGYKPMKSQGGDIWSYDIPEPVESWNFHRGKYIYYKAKAEDISGNSGESGEQQELIDSINDAPSVRIANAFNPWEKGLITLTAEASDDDGTIASVKFEYSFDKANWAIIGSPVTKLPYAVAYDTKTSVPETAKSVWIKATALDNENLSAENISSISFGIDNQSPITSILDYDGLWRNKDFIINLAASDGNGIGVTSISYRLNDGNKQDIAVDGQATASVAITKEDQANKLEYWSTDKIGNEEQHKVLSNIKLDKTAPTFSGWSQDPSDLTEDSSGKFRISVQVNDEISGLIGKVPLFDYHIGPVEYGGYRNMASDDGKIWYADIPEPVDTWDSYRGQYVYYKVKCEDVAGNVSDVERFELIDNINDPPTVRIESKFNDWEKDVLKIEAKASDTDGRITEVQFEYSADKQNWRPIGSIITQEPFSIEWDTKTALKQAQFVWIRVTVKDNDNESAYYLYPTSVGIDNQPPETSDDYNDLWHREDFVITLTADDGNGIGVSKDNIRYKLNNGAEKNILSDGQPRIVEEGIHQLEYWSIDDLGSIETHRTIQSIRLDKTPPQIADWVKDPIDLTENSSSPLRIFARITDGAGSGLIGKIPQFSYRLGTKDIEYANMNKGETDDVWYYDIPEPEESWNAYRGNYIYYKIKSVDVAGNITESPEASELIDDINDPPVVKITSSFKDWENSSLGIEATASDSDGTITSVQFDYSTNKVTWTPIGTSTNLPYSIVWDTKAIPEVAQSIWIRATATDDDGDSAEYTIPNSFKIDNQTPVTNQDYNGSWYNKDFNINLTSNDGDGIGVSVIAYKLNNGEKQEISTDGKTAVLVNITQEFTNVLEYWSVDKLGNEESHKILSNISLDKTAPEFANWELTPANLTEDTESSLRIQVQISDGKGSGLTGKIPQLDYRIGDSKYDGYDNMITADGKTWYFDIPEPKETWNSYRNRYVYYKVSATDIAGNTGESSEKSELIDSVNDPPVVKLITTFKDWEAGTIKIEAEASDPDESSPLVKFEYSLDNTDWKSIDGKVAEDAQTYSVTWQTKPDIDLEKSVWIRATAIDADDNSVLVVSDVSKKFGIDNQPPLAGNWSKSPANLTEDTPAAFRVTISFDDQDGSGVRKVEIAYRIENLILRDYQEMKQESGNWYYDINEAGGWDKYRGQNLYYKARATDSVGNETETKEQQELIDDINDPPTGLIVTSYKDWEGGTLDVEANADDQDGQVTSVQFQYSFDKTNWIAIGSPIAGEPYTVRWNSSSIELDPEVWLKIVITDDDKAITENSISKPFGIDNKPPALADWILTPANLTESSNESFLRVEVKVSDQGSGVDTTKVQFAYKLGNASYSSYQSMFRLNDDSWFYEIPKPLGNWSAYAGQNISYKVKAFDIVGNSIESEERNELIDSTTGSISGSIAPRDSWQGARVIVQKDNQTVLEGSVSQIDGSYIITGVPAGIYNLLVTSPGYGTNKSQTNVEVKLGQNTVVPIIQMLKYAVENLTRTQGGIVEFRDSTLKSYSLVIDPGSLARDSKVVLGFSGNEPTSVPNPNVRLLDKAIGMGFEGVNLEKPLKLILPRPAGVTDPKAIMTFIYNGRDYRIVDRNNIAQNDTMITINITPDDIKNFSDQNHEFAPLSQTDTVFYVLITRFDEPTVNTYDIGIFEPQLTSGRVTGFITPSITGRKVALVVHGITSRLDDMVGLISELKALKPTNSTNAYYDSVLVFNYDAGADLVSTNGTLLASELSRVFGTFNGKIDVLAHCSGGLVVRHAIVSHGADQYIGSLVMLGTPNGGINRDLLKPLFNSFVKKTQSYTAWSYYRDGWQSIMQDSQYIASINSQLGKSVNTHYYGIGASDPNALTQAENNDGLVYMNSADFTSNINFPSFEKGLTKLFDKVNVIPPIVEGLPFMSQTRHFAMTSSTEVRDKIIYYLRGKSENISIAEHDIDLIPGNRIEAFKVVLKNIGTTAITGVSAKLSTQSSFIRNYADTQQGIERDTFVYGDMLPDTTKTGTFSFYVNENAKNVVGQQIAFTLTISNSGDSSVNILQFSAPVGGNLIRIALNSQDQTKLAIPDVAKDITRPQNDGDIAVEPGEIMKISITLENRSSSSISSVSAILKTDDLRVKGLVGTTEVNMATTGLTMDYGTLTGLGTSVRIFSSVKLGSDTTLLGAQVKFTLDIKSGSDIIGRDEFTVRIGADIVVDRIDVDPRLVPGGDPRDIAISFKNITSSEIANMEVRITPESRDINISNDREQISLLGALQSKTIYFDTTVYAGFNGYDTFTLDIRVAGKTINTHYFESYFGKRTQYSADWITSDNEATNSDKIAEPDELIKLRIARRNLSKDMAERVRVTIETTDAAILQPIDRNLGDYSDIAANIMYAEPSRDYEVRIAPATDAVFANDTNFPLRGRTVEFTLKVEENRQLVGEETYKMRIGGVIRYLQPAGSSALIAALRDSRTLSTVNDGDGLLEPGETIEMTVTLINTTNDTTVSDVVGILDTDEIDVDIDRNYDEINYGTMSYSGSSKRRTGVYRFTIDDRIEVDSIPFRLDISGRISNAVQNLGTDEFIIPISR